MYIRGYICTVQAMLYWICSLLIFDVAISMTTFQIISLTLNIKLYIVKNK